jgi:hypothetical protein
VIEKTVGPLTLQASKQKRRIARVRRRAETRDKTEHGDGEEEDLISWDTNLALEMRTTKIIERGG